MSQPFSSRCNRNHQNHHQHSVRLQNFLSNHHVYQLHDIVNYVCEFAQDRDGSKFIQRKLDEAPDHRKTTLFNEIYANLHALMMHRFANFVVQKFFTIGNADQCLKMYEHIKVNFLELSLNKYGCRVVQKAIETATPLNLYFMMQQFSEENVMILVMDPNGNHVIQNIFRTAATSPNRHIQVILFVLKIMCEKQQHCKSSSSQFQISPFDVNNFLFALHFTGRSFRTYEIACDGNVSSFVRLPGDSVYFAARNGHTSESHL